MADKMISAEQALDEVLGRVFGGQIYGWREYLAEAIANDVADGRPFGSHARSGFTCGDLRRWSSPLLAAEAHPLPATQEQ